MTSDNNTLLEEVYDELERFFVISPESIFLMCVKLADDYEQSATMNNQNVNREHLDVSTCNENDMVNVEAYVMSCDKLQDPTLNHNAHDTSLASDGVQGTKGANSEA